MLRGDFVGLCQLLGSTAYPPLHAARIAAWLLGRSRPVARMYRRHCMLMRELAISKREPAETVTLFDEELRRLLMRGRLLGAVDVEVLFSPDVWDHCGDELIPIWSAVLILLAVNVDLWECVLLGVEPPQYGAASEGSL